MAAAPHQLESPPQEAAEATDSEVTSGRVRLLSADARLAQGVPAEEREQAERLIVATATRVPRGPWVPDAQAGDGTEGFGLLVLRGTICREVVLAGRRCTQLLGPGDIIRPGAHGTALVDHGLEWSVFETAVVAVLDDRFALAMRRWPGLAEVVHERLFDQADRLALDLAIAHLPRVEQRVLATLWHLADRFGRVTAEGVVVPLKLTHEAIGRLVGAQRPTVTLALAELDTAGAVSRAVQGGWMLSRESRGLLSPQVEMHPTVSSAARLSAATAA